MAKLSSEVLERGRDTIRAGDLEGLLAWVKKHSPLTPSNTVRLTYEKLFKAGNTELGIKLFDAAFIDADPAQDAKAILFVYGLTAILILGAVGGVFYLLQSCVSMVP